MKFTLREENYGRSFICEITRDDMCGCISNVDSPFEVTKMINENEELRGDVKRGEQVALSDDLGSDLEDDKTETGGVLDDNQNKPICLPYAMKRVTDENTEFFTSTSLVH